ncbi:MAG: hypothetical protein U9R08_07195 [Nanoarchaeota archaeon]|nr:hypothetical protein [Nanoarchaeota archaeon]
MKRGQAALEFLMTYGWVILIVIIVIGALAAFGVFDVGRLIQDKCLLPTSLSCDESGYSTADSGTISLVLLNSFGRDVEISELTFTDKDSDQVCTETFATPVKILNQRKELINVTSCNLASKSGKYRMDIDLTYKFTDGQLTKVLKGDLTLTVAE